MKDEIVEVIKNALDELKKIDGCLFKCQIEEGFDYDSRKLHEVCINHRLSNHLEYFFFQKFPDKKGKLFFDIEFNREGENIKKLLQQKKLTVVRPDIILHNRKSRNEKINLLVVECKKEDASKNDISEDKKKIKAFMRDVNYKYEYGLQVVYGTKSISGTLFYHTENIIKKEKI